MYIYKTFKNTSILFKIPCIKLELNMIAKRLILMKFIEEIHTYYSPYNNSQKSGYAIIVFTTKYNANFEPVDNLCRLIGQN